MPLPLAQIRELVGEITEEALAHVDVALTRNVGLFVPLSGPCGYAITPEHTHPTYSFVVSFDDRCRVAIDGQVLRSQPGRFTAFSPGVPHQELPSSGVSRYVAVLLREPYLHAELTDYGMPLPELRAQSFVTPPRLVEALREFMAEYEEQGPGCQALLEASGKRIAHLLIRAILACPKRDERIDLRMAANHTVSFMHQHLEERLTITELARVARLSPSHFARVFREELGLTPIEYLNELRLTQARRRLRDSAATITEIALGTGFNSSSYFCRCFSARFRMSPSEYRRSVGR